MQKVILFFKIVLKNIGKELTNKPAYKRNHHQLHTKTSFNETVSKWVAKGYVIVDKNDIDKTAILQKQNKINHGLHIVLTLLTAGFWIIPYFLILLSHKKNGDTINISMNDAVQ